MWPHDVVLHDFHSEDEEMINVDTAKRLSRALYYLDLANREYEGYIYKLKEMGAYDARMELERLQRRLKDLINETAKSIEVVSEKVWE